MARIPTLVAAALLAAAPAMAQQPAQQQQGGSVSVGTLRCDVGGSAGFVFGSTRRVDCQFFGAGGRREHYTGEIKRYGVDLGFTNAAIMIWGVLAPTSDLQPGVLAGTFAGVSGGVTAGVGVGANVLLGGSNRSIQLQPLSVEGNRGLNLALGVAELTLQAAPGR